MFTRCLETLHRQNRSSLKRNLFNFSISGRRTFYMDRVHTMLNLVWSRFSNKTKILFKSLSTKRWKPMYWTLVTKKSM